MPPDTPHASGVLRTIADQGTICAAWSVRVCTALPSRVSTTATRWECASSRPSTCAPREYEYLGDGELKP